MRALTPVFATAHAAAIRTELAVERRLDALSSPPAAVMPDRLTIVVKTFERPHVVLRLLESIERLQPAAGVIVVDDSRRAGVFPGQRVIELPPGAGVSAGRQAGLDAVATEFVAMVDDDFVFTRHTHLGAAVQRLEREPDIDLIGGRVINLPRYGSVDYSRFATGRQIGGLPVYTKVATFYVARTDRLRVVGWDPRLKRLDHGDFFARADGRLVTALDESIRCLHARTPFDDAYMAHRMDVQADRDLLDRRYDG